MRKQFTTQLAATCFMTYILCLTSRLPSRFHLSRATGQIAMSELLPSSSSQAPVFASSDVVPFRMTPNLQRFIGSIFQEGILIPSLMAIGRGLTEPEVGIMFSGAPQLLILVTSVRARTAALLVQ